jgi:hypothetical protein
MTLRPKHLLRTVNKLGFLLLATACSSSRFHSLKSCNKLSLCTLSFCSDSHYSRMKRTFTASLTNVRQDTDTNTLLRLDVGYYNPLQFSAYTVRSVCVCVSTTKLKTGRSNAYTCWDFDENQLASSSLISDTLTRVIIYIQKRSWKLKKESIYQTFVLQP